VSASFDFRKIEPRAWRGRYRRVPGETTAFHVRWLDGRWWPVVEWPRDDGIGTCAMVAESDVQELVDAVNAAKAAQGGPPGGAFLVDEYGRVLVPAGDGAGAAVYVAGECRGVLRFEDPFTPGATFDLYDDSDLEPGDHWDRPYLGIRYQLSRFDELYFWLEGSTGAGKITPPLQDAGLVANLRRVRPYGAVRFLVGPGGVAITKVPPLWDARYVGRVDLDTWFQKEELE
jgi:hypothetical protein